MRNKIGFASSIAVGISLLAIFFVFLIRCYTLSSWIDLSTIEYVIILTQIARVGVVYASRTMRAQPLFSIILFSIEVFSIPFLALLAIWTGDQIYTAWMAAILTTWLGVTSLILSPVAIFEYVKSMAKNASLTSALVIGTLEIGGMLYLCDTLLAASSTIQGPAALGALIIKIGSTQISSIGFTGGASNDVLAISMVTFGVGMLVYIALGSRISVSQVRISDTLLLPLIGIVAALVWMLSVLSISSDVVFVFTVPTIVAAVILWGVSSGR